MTMKVEGLGLYSFIHVPPLMEFCEGEYIERERDIVEKTRLYSVI